MEGTKTTERKEFSVSDPVEDWPFGESGSKDVCFVLIVDSVNFFAA